MNIGKIGGIQRLVAFFAAILFLIAAFPAAAYAADVPEAVLDAQNGIVRISASWRTGVGRGTGFIVGTEDDWYVITCAHCILDESMGGSADEVYVLPKTGVSIAADVIACVPEKDLAILRIGGDIPDKKILPLNPDAEAGDVVYASGYPLTADISNPEGGRIDPHYTGADYQTITAGTINDIVMDSYGYKMPSGCEYLDLSLAATHGNSGGPILFPDGSVAGVVASTIVTTNELAYAATAREVMTLLEANGIEYAQASSGSERENDSSHEPQADTPANTQGNPDGREENDSSREQQADAPANTQAAAFVFITIGIVGVAVLVIGVYISRKQKREATLGWQPQPGQQYPYPQVIRQPAAPAAPRIQQQMPVPAPIRKTAAPVPSGRFCSNCGAKADGKFCSECGRPV